MNEPRLALLPTDRTGFTEAAVAEALDELSDRAKILCLSTADKEGIPHANTCYFARQARNKIVILTPPTTRHVLNARNQPRCAAVFAIEPEQLGDPICGVQIACDLVGLEGHAAEAAYEAYVNKFATFKSMAPSLQFILEKFESRFFVLKIRSGKLVDEARFGREAFIEFRFEE